MEVSIMTNNFQFEASDFKIDLSNASTDLYKKLSKIMKELTPIFKEGFNTKDSYSYARELTVLNQIRPLFVENELLMLPSVTEMRLDDVKGNSGNGGIDSKLTSIMVSVTIVDSDTGIRGFMLR